MCVAVIRLHPDHPQSELSHIFTTPHCYNALSFMWFRDGDECTEFGNRGTTSNVTVQSAFTSFQQAAMT